MKTLKQLIVEYGLEKGWSVEDNHELFEIFTECFDTVQVGEPDRHRWYTNYDKVVKVPDNGVDRFFEYTDMDVHGECATREDCGWEVPDLDDLPEVFPKTISKVIYE